MSHGVTKVAGKAVAPGGALAPPVTRGAKHWHHPRDQPALGAKQPGHAWLSQHYKWAMDEVFLRGHSHVVVVEDDMQFSADFLHLFQVSNRARRRHVTHTVTRVTFAATTSLPQKYTQQLPRTQLLKHPSVMCPHCMVGREMQSTAWLMDVDSSLWCVSSWNDFGSKPWRWQPHRLLRTSFFPGAFCCKCSLLVCAFWVSHLISCRCCNAIRGVLAQGWGG